VWRREVPESQGREGGGEMMKEHSLCEVGCSSCGNLYSTTCTVRIKAERGVIMEACPYCGSIKKANFENEFTCNSFYGTDVFVRSVDCYKRQLTQQAELLRQALEVVRGLKNLKVVTYPNDYSLERLLTKAAALLQTLERLGRENKESSVNNLHREI
jgi:transcription elongation factor Elf1